MDVIRVLSGDLFDIHAAFSADQQRRTPVATVDRQSDVEFVLDVGQFFDQQLLNRRAFGPSLGRDQVGRQHLFSCR